MNVGESEKIIFALETNRCWRIEGAEQPTSAPVASSAIASADRAFMRRMRVLLKTDN